jgi:CheY-like chemotaxis protein
VQLSHFADFPAPAGKPAAMPFSLLLVEDSDGDAFIIRRALRAALPERPCTVTEAPRLADAFLQLRQKTFDCILLDLNLPDLNGLIVVSALHMEAPHIPIIAYSGLADPKFKESVITGGAMVYLVKGYENPEALRRIFLKALSSQHA